MPDVPLELAIKSTLDYQCSQLAIAMRESGDADLAELMADGLDNLVTIDATTKSSRPAVLWQIGMFQPAPIAPLYEIKFSVGVKTTEDDANYIMLKALSAISNYFKVGFDFQVYDYSVPEDDFDAGAPLGVVLVTGTSSSPMLFDNQSGLKLLDLQAKVVQYI